MLIIAERMIYKIKFAIHFILILITFTAYGQKDKTDFPDQIQTTKTDKHVRVKGSKVYAVIPADYQYIKELARFQKSDDLYIQVLESNGSNFIQSKPNFTRKVLEGKGAKVDILNTIRLNEFEAIYNEGPSKYPGETKLVLIFGDESFVVMIVGVCKTVDTIGKKGLQEIFKSVYYDKSLQIDPLELANFEFDQTITNFKYTLTASNLFIYTENGKSDAQNPTANAILISVFPKMTEEKAETFSNTMLLRYEQNGVMLDNKTITKTKMNDRTAYVLETKIKNDNKDGIMYQVMLIYENTSILFMASAYSDINNYLSKFKKTVGTIKLKQ